MSSFQTNYAEALKAFNRAYERNHGTQGYARTTLIEFDLLIEGYSLVTSTMYQGDLNWPGVLLQASEDNANVQIHYVVPTSQYS